MASRRRSGDPAIRRSGDPAIRRSGDPAIRRSGDPAIRRSGDPAIRRFKRMGKARRTILQSHGYQAFSVVKFDRGRTHDGILDSLRQAPIFAAARGVLFVYGRSPWHAARQNTGRAPGGCAARFRRFIPALRKNTKPRADSVVPVAGFKRMGKARRTILQSHGYQEFSVVKFDRGHARRQRRLPAHLQATQPQVGLGSDSWWIVLFRRIRLFGPREAGFGVRPRGGTRKRQLFAINRKRRNCRSGAQPIQASRALTLNALAHQPGSASHSPSGPVATCRIP